ncbi:MAG: hypothetical protein AAGK02_02520, partial [Pseudomonadota bacterium]
MSAANSISGAGKSAHKRAKTQTSLALWPVALIVIIAVVNGGGGVRYGLANLLVQLSAIILLAFNRAAFFKFWREAPIPLRALVAASLALPAIHLVPLPTELSISLPGRETVRQSLDLIGSERWFPASVDPARTLVALTGLILPVTLLAVGWSLSTEQRVKLGWVLVGLGMLNVMVGIPQMLSSGQTGLMYPENPMPGVLFGTFANRNSTGLFLVAALTLAALLPPFRAHKAFPILRIGICVLLLLG